MTTVLIIDDDFQFGSLVGDGLKERGHKYILVEDFHGAERALNDDTYIRISHVLCDWDLGSNTENGGEVVRRLHLQFGSAKYAIMSGLTRRGVPEFAEFFTKDQVLAIMEWVGGLPNPKTEIPTITHPLPEREDEGSGWDHELNLKPVELLNRGILWYINRVAFHPRGMALGLDLDDDGQLIGWVIHQTDGESISFSPEIDDEKFQAFEGLLEELKNE